MNPIQTITGRGIPLQGNDIDTDRIIPARFLRCVTFDGLGQHAFADDRAASNGQHPFDQLPYQGASILVVNGNFGCGSSREHAPQSLAKWGIKAIIGESFAEIFFGNCVALGVPCVTVKPEQAQQLQETIATIPTVQINIDLTTLQVDFQEQMIPVQIHEGARSMFLTGQWDSCSQLVNNAAQIRHTANQLPYIAWAN
jgi:3-isopropylmalate/(R)-2-methylmalate dehydratase small subunit